MPGTLPRRTLGALLGPLLARPALAQARPVTIVVPFPPGGSTDVAARLLAERMAPSLGVPVLVENRPGAATAIGAEYVARAAPDGHTVLISSGSTLTILPLLPERLPYRVEDFAPIVLLTTLPFAVVVRRGLAEGIQDFLALARSRPGTLNYGSNGPSSFNNIATAVLCQGLGIRMQEVSYRGDAQQMNDLVAGTLDLMVVGGSAAFQAVRAGGGTIIGWTGEGRVAATPGVPAFAELNPAIVAQTWFGLLAPARSPRAMLDRINAAANAALAAPELQERLLAEAQFVRGGTPEDLSRFMQQEANRWRPVLRRLGLARE